MSISSISSGAGGEIVDVEFDAIESALMKTARGRAFLSEFTRRNRAADTQTVLTAIERLEGTMRAQDPIADVQRFRGDVLEMARRIADTRSQIVAMRAEDESDSTLGRAKGELDAIVQATESATGGILAAAEEIQEIAWTLREGGFAPETCEAIDERATNIYIACSFQDLTSQRIRKVIDAMQFLESRITQMIDIWGFSAEELAQPSTQQTGLAGPTHDGLKQDEVDIAMVDALRAVSTFSDFDLGAPERLDEAGPSAESAALEQADTAPSDAFAGTLADEEMPAPVPVIVEASSPPQEPAAPPAVAAASSEPPDMFSEGYGAPDAEDEEVLKLRSRMAQLDGLSARSRISEFE